jgi:hypothetical protein
MVLGGLGAGMRWWVLCRRHLSTVVPAQAGSVFQQPKADHPWTFVQMAVTS